MASYEELRNELAAMWEGRAQLAAAVGPEDQATIRSALDGGVAPRAAIVTQLFAKAVNPTISALDLTIELTGLEHSSRSLAKNVVLRVLRAQGVEFLTGNDPYVSNPLRVDRLEATKQPDASWTSLIAALTKADSEPTLTQPMLGFAFTEAERTNPTLSNSLSQLMSVQSRFDKDDSGSVAERNEVLGQISPAAVRSILGDAAPVSWSRQQGSHPEVPWVAVAAGFSTPTGSGYPVYLGTADGSAVYISVGIATDGSSSTEIDEKVAALRARASAPEGWVTEIDLRSSQSGGRPQRYERGTVYARRYGAGEIPDEAELADDLESAVALCSALVTATGGLAPVCDDFADYLLSCEISFGAEHALLVRRFVASLATKPFVILTGLSGSGKTQLALRFGEWLGPEQSLVVPVRPDWASPEYLLGYEDGLRAGRWVVPDVLEFTLRALRNPGSPYLLVLDEMNLAHVERYFADFLSGMESGKGVVPDVAWDAESAEWRVPAEGLNKLPIPANLFVVGTVNVDETTYMFSPKVLDRASTIEFRVPTESIGVEIPPIEHVEREDELVAAFAQAAGEPTEFTGATDREQTLSWLRDVHAILSTHGREFGHRAASEALEFAALFTRFEDASLADAFDLVMMQKILPKLSGTRRDVGGLITELIAHTASPLLPISNDKLQRMERRLEQVQYTGFVE